MMQNKTKSGLGIILSKLSVFENPHLMKEQYATDSEAAAGALWFAYMQGDIEGMKVADLGCGTGLLGIAAILLGAERVYFIDSDAAALEIAKKNIVAAADLEKAEVIRSDIKKFEAKVDTVIQNPPFGTKEKHADREFLLQAFKIANVVYSFHKIVTSDFVTKVAADNGFVVTNIIPMQLQLKKTQTFHKSKIRRVDVGLFRISTAPLNIKHNSM